jgi:hypothetical protein
MGIEEVQVVKKIRAQQAELNSVKDADSLSSPRMGVLAG